MLCESKIVESHLKIKSEPLCLVIPQFTNHEENYFFDVPKGKTS